MLLLTIRIMKCTSQFHYKDIRTSYKESSCSEREHVTPEKNISRKYKLSSKSYTLIKCQVREPQTFIYIEHKYRLLEI